MSSQGAMSGEQTNNSSGLCPIEGRYYGSCISATSIPLTPTVLIIILETAMLCCRLA